MIDKQHIVSFFKNAFSTTPVENVPFEKVLEFIKCGFWEDKITKIKKDYEKSKTQLPCFTPSGTFKYRHDIALYSYSGLVHLDYDKVDSVYNLKLKLINSPYVFAAFFSPSFNGLKVFVKVSSTSNDHLTAFTLVRKHFDNLAGISSDTVVKNLSRLCFVSMDKDLYFQPEAKTFPIEEMRPKPKVTIPDRVPIANENAVFSFLHGFTMNGKYMSSALSLGCQEGNRNNFLFTFACNCNRYGLDQSEAVEYCWKLLPGNNKDVTDGELLRTVKSAYKYTHEYAKFRLPENLEV